MFIIRTLVSVLIRRRAALLVRLLGAPLLTLLLRRLTRGGLDRLLNRARRVGLGAKVDSWIATGRGNEPLTDTEVRRIMEPAEIRRISIETGLPDEEVTHRVATALPVLIDEVTPDGRVPSPGRLDRLTGRIQRYLPRSAQG